MGGIFSAPKAPPPSPKVTEAQEKAEARAVAAETREATAAQARRRVRRTGGLRLLMSPARQDQGGQTKLGPGS